MVTEAEKNDLLVAGVPEESLPGSVYVTVTAGETASDLTKFLVTTHGPQFIARYTGTFSETSPDIWFGSIRDSWMGQLPNAEIYIELVPGQLVPAPPQPPGP